MGHCRAHWLIGLGLGLATCGCAAGVGPGKGNLASKGPNEVGPPTPSPALYIPAAPRSPLQSTEFQTLEVPMPVKQASAVAANGVEMPPLTPSTSASDNPEAAKDPLISLRQLYRKAAEQVAPMDSYVLRLKRREVANGRQKPEEIILFKFRREPFSVFLKWLGNEAKGREVVYVKGQYDNKIHTRVAAGDALLVPAGTVISLAVDSPLVKSSSRHPITQAGLEHFVERFGLLVDAVEKKTYPGSVRYLGLLRRPEFEHQVEGVLQTIPAGAEASLPRGGQRLWFFDTRHHLPALMVTQDETGQEVEYYCHDRIEFPVSLDGDDFNPQQLWGKKQ